MTTTLHNDLAPSTQCTYIGHDYKRLVPTCCKPSVEGRSYCAEHVALVYQAGTARAKRKKDTRLAAAVWDLESEFNAAVEELIAEGYDPSDERWDALEAE